MTQVVYTAVEDIRELSAAEWHVGDFHSYAITKAMAEKLTSEVMLVARRDNRGGIGLVCARSGHRDQWNDLVGFGWRDMSPVSARLAQFFAARRETFGKQGVAIDDPKIAQIVRNIVARVCGSEQRDFSPFGPVHECISSINADLRSLGVDGGDSTFVPMFNAAQALHVAVHA